MVLERDGLFFFTLLVLRFNDVNSLLFLLLAVVVEPAGAKGDDDQDDDDGCHAQAHRLVDYFVLVNCLARCRCSYLPCLIRCIL